MTKLINETAYKILTELRNKPTGFNEMLKKRHFAPKTLSSYLKELNRMGFVKRRIKRSAPIRVSYELTSEGMALTDKLYTLCSTFKLRID